MGRLIYLPCLALTDVGIYLSGRQLGMTEQLLNDSEVGTAIEKMGGKGMPEDVGMNFFLKAGFLGAFIKDFLYSPCWQSTTVLIEENGIRFLL